MWANYLTLHHSLYTSIVRIVNIIIFICSCYPFLIVSAPSYSMQFRKHRFRTMVFRSKRVLNTMVPSSPGSSENSYPWTTWVWTGRCTYMWILKISAAVLTWICDCLESETRKYKGLHYGTWASVNFGIHRRFWNKSLRDNRVCNFGQCC